jgi:hypothetical protein
MKDSDWQNQAFPVSTRIPRRKPHTSLPENSYLNYMDFELAAPD